MLQGAMMQRIVRAIQDQTIIDRVADVVQPPAKRAFRGTSGSGRTLKNFLSGTWLGHPLHPILKDVPIGGWTMAAIFDALDAFAPSESFQRAADISILTGILGALASAVTGLADWSDTTGRARRIGEMHAILNVSATLLYISALIAKRSRRASRVSLAYAGYGVMLLGSYLGGHLVFGEQIGVNHARQTDLPEDYRPVLPASELAPDEPREVNYNGLPVVLVRHGERIYAPYARCSHLAGPLAQGSIEDGSIRCPWHGSRFSLEDGAVLEGPATSPQPCFDTRVIDGMIEIRSRERESP